MISDYFKRIEKYFGSLTKNQKDLLMKTKKQLSDGYGEETYEYDSLIKEKLMRSIMAQFTRCSRR